MILVVVDVIVAGLIDKQLHAEVTDGPSAGRQSGFRTAAAARFSSICSTMRFRCRGGGLQEPITEVTTFGVPAVWVAVLVNLVVVVVVSLQADTVFVTVTLGRADEQ